MDFGQALLNIAKSAIGPAYNLSMWEKASRNYGKYLKEDYGKLTILAKPDMKKGMEIYTDVNVMEKVSAFQRYAPEELNELFFRAQ